MMLAAELTAAAEIEGFPRPVGLPNRVSALLDKPAVAPGGSTRKAQSRMRRLKAAASAGSLESQRAKPMSMALIACATSSPR